MEISWENKKGDQENRETTVIGKRSELKPVKKFRPRE